MSVTFQQECFTINKFTRRWGIDRLAAHLVAFIFASVREPPAREQRRSLAGGILRLRPKRKEM